MTFCIQKVSFTLFHIWADTKMRTLTLGAHLEASVF